jgi:dipeptidyl aminopeptidase/acylaminoacyl peptidase
VWVRIPVAVALLAAAVSAGGAPASPRHGAIVYKCADSLCVTAPGAGAGRLLLASNRPWPQWDPAFSPDGRAIAFRGYYNSAADGDYALYVARPTGCTAVRLTRGVAGDPSWSPDGRWIVFDTSGYGDVYKVRWDGTGLTRLFEGHGIDEGWSPAWSPDGRWIAFVRVRRHGSRIWLMRPDGTGLRLLHTDPIAFDHDLAWSHDGRRLAFARSPSSDHSAIAVMRADGTGFRLLTRGTPAWNPVWLQHDTGIEYLAATHVHGIGRLSVMHPDGRDVRRLAGPATIQFGLTGASAFLDGCA